MIATVISAQLLANAAASGPPLVMLPVADIDALNSVHLSWYTSGINDVQIPDSLPPPSDWLESSSDHGTAVALRIIHQGDSSALYAIDLWIRDTVSLPVQVELWSDSSDRPGKLISQTRGAPPDSLQPLRARFYLDIPIRVHSGDSFWAIAYLPQATPQALGLYTRPGGPMLVGRMVHSGVISWQPWPDFSLACALVLAVPTPSSGAPTADGFRIDILRTTAGANDTTFLASIPAGQTAFSDHPAIMGADYTYIWKDSAQASIVALPVPYSRATALEWSTLAWPSGIHDSSTCTATLTNRSGRTLEITTQAEIWWDSGGSVSFLLPSVTLSPSVFSLGPQASIALSARFSVPHASSGPAVVQLEAADSSTFSARSARVTTPVRVGATGLAPEGNVPMPVGRPYPNPANVAAVIPIPAWARSVSIYNVAGARVAHMTLRAGAHEIRWPDPKCASTAPSGTYFIHISGAAESLTQTLTLLK